MNAKEMFKQLGYEFEKEYTSDGGNDTYRYNKCSRPNDSVIFYLDGKQIIIYQTFNTINVNELQAIIQQCKELGWLEEEQREETNFEHYKDEIIEVYIEDLAISKGRMTQCCGILCSECGFADENGDCIGHRRIIEWLKKPYQKQTYKLTQFEKELLECYSDVYSFKVFNSLNGMKEKGYFKGIDDNELIGDILAKCEVVG